MMIISGLMLLVVCSVLCNVTSFFTQKEIPRYFMNVPKRSLLKAPHDITNGCNCPNIHNLKASDCADLLKMGHFKSGVYQIWPNPTPNSKIIEGISFYVYCDMDTNGGGWTVIQRRGDFKRLKDYFYQNWESYKKGFGDIEEDFWLGNEKIFSLTNQKLYSVRFDLRDVDKFNRFAVYDEFWIEDEKHNYTLHIDLYSGDAGDSMKYHDNQTFSTFDKDNVRSCARNRKGGWWYKSCHTVNLNGLYYKGKHGNNMNDGISWESWKGSYESLEWTEIKIRPKYFRTIFS